MLIDTGCAAICSPREMRGSAESTGASADRRMHDGTEDWGAIGENVCPSLFFFL